LKVEELIKTGSLKYYENLKKIFLLILRINYYSGLGPKRIMLLYYALKIKNKSDLLKAAKQNKLAKLVGTK